MPNDLVEQIKKSLVELADEERAKHSARYFKTGPGEYAEGDRFLGVKVPEQRRIARRFREAHLSDATALLKSPIHEERLTALFLMVGIYQRSARDQEAQERVVRAYLKNLRWVNNWDLVDASAPKIWGNWLLERERRPLYEQIDEKSLWVRRVALLATSAFIDRGDGADALALCKRVLDDPEDLIHKASGWMLREVGERVSRSALRGFLREHASQMPRTMLRYAIEKLPPEERKRWLAAKTRSGRA